MERTNWWIGTMIALGTLAFASLARAGDADPFGSYISPVSNPTLFEDPRMTTEVRPIYAYHNIDKDFPTQGGHVNIAAVQARLALSERWGLIATKDGYVWLKPAYSNTQEGWANVAFGLKHALYYHPERDAIMTIGLRYEAASGNRKVFQGYGSGFMNPFLSAATGFDNFHVMAYADTRLPLAGEDSNYFDFSAHADYKIGQLYPLIELNWVQVIHPGHRLPIDQEGFDFFPFGSQFAHGGVVTAAFGARYRALENMDLGRGYKGGIDLGAVFEVPITDQHDVFGYRATTDMIFWVR